MASMPALSEGSLSTYDLVIHAGQLFRPGTGLGGPGGVAVAGDRIAAVGAAVRGPAREVIRLPNAVLLPGLVDLHAHPARGDSRYGIDPDRDSRSGRPPSSPKARRAPSIWRGTRRRSSSAH